MRRPVRELAAREGHRAGASEEENPRLERLFRSDFDTLRALKMRTKRVATQPSTNGSDSEEEGKLEKKRRWWGR